MHYLSADYIFVNENLVLKDHVLIVQSDYSIEGILPNNSELLVNKDIQSYRGLLCPGFINTHCHLELSWAKGRMDRNTGLDSFIHSLEKLKTQTSEDEILSAIETEAIAMHTSGIVSTADISNTNDTIAYKSSAKQHFHNFIEVYGSNPAYADILFEKALSIKAQFENKQRFRTTLTPHSTYSLSDELMQKTVEKSPHILSIHHQENMDENEFFKTGTGPISDRRKRFNPLLENYCATGRRPMESIAKHFNKLANILLVHNTVSTAEDIDFIETYFENAYWCLCPNANIYIENRLPDIMLLRKKKARITLGTDSLASNSELSILQEMKTIQSAFPEIPLGEILQWATLNGAIFLGIAKNAGKFDNKTSPGVVLIENMDLENMKLTNKSTSRILIPATI